MSDEFFDSNLLVYIFDRRDEHKRVIARRTVARALATGSASISFQVVQETLNAITTKLPDPLNRGDAERFLERVLMPLWRVNPSQALYQSALRIQGRYGFSFYDSLIVAAALEAGCDRLMTEDLHDGQRIEGLTIVNPFRA
jgi:predicted nucleic acid-binding protein